MLSTRRVAVTLLLIGMTLPALGQTPTPSSAAAPAAAPQHGGGGFALLLLDYRVALERLIEDLREGTAELVHGADMAPAEIVDAVHRVTEGADSVALGGGLLAIVAAGLGARQFMRRRLSGGATGGLVPSRGRLRSEARTRALPGAGRSAWARRFRVRCDCASRDFRPDPRVGTYFPPDLCHRRACDVRCGAGHASAAGTRCARPCVFGGCPTALLASCIAGS